MKYSGLHQSHSIIHQNCRRCRRHCLWSKNFIWSNFAPHDTWIKNVPHDGQNCLSHRAILSSNDKLLHICKVVLSFRDLRCFDTISVLFQFYAKMNTTFLEQKLQTWCMIIMIINIVNILVMIYLGRYMKAAAESKTGTKKRSIWEAISKSEKETKLLWKICHARALLFVRLLEIQLLPVLADENQNTYPMCTCAHVPCTQ